MHAGVVVPGGEFMSRREFLHHIRDRHNKAFRSSIWNFPHLLIGLLASVLLSWYSVLYLPWSVQYITPGIPIPIPLTGIVVLTFLAFLFHAITDSRLILCSDYVLYIEGLASWKKHSIRILYRHIREIEIDQTILQQIFNTGDIFVLSVASKDSSDIHMRGVRAPRKVKDLIEARMVEGPTVTLGTPAYAD